MGIEQMPQWVFWPWIGILLGATLCTVYTDIRWYWIPDGVIYAVGAGNGVALAGGWIQPDGLTGLIIASGFLMLHMLYPQGLGSGDGKLAAVLCLGCHGQSAYGMMMAAFLSAGCCGVLLWAYCRIRLLPFGPFLWGGWWISWLWGKEWLTWLGW